MDGDVSSTANLGMSPSGSLVKTLQKCVSRILAFSSLLNFIDFLSLPSPIKGETPVFVFNLLLICDQNTLGYFCAISLSYFRLDCRIKFVTWFLHHRSFSLTSNDDVRYVHSGLRLEVLCLGENLSLPIIL